VLQNEISVAGLMAIELKAKLVCDQRLEERFALDERQARNVAAVEVQKIEGVIDEPNVALAVGRRLSMGEAWQPLFIDATQLAVDIGGLHVQARERCNGAWIFGGPIEPGPRQQLNAAVDARGHAIAVELDLVHPLCARRRLLDQLGKLRRDEGGKRGNLARRTGLDGLAGRTLDNTRHAENKLGRNDHTTNAVILQQIPAGNGGMTIMRQSRRRREDCFRRQAPRMNGKLRAAQSVLRAECKARNESRCCDSGRFQALLPFPSPRRDERPRG
jgi:hypothetical protein